MNGFKSKPMYGNLYSAQCIIVQNNGNVNMHNIDHTCSSACTVMCNVGRVTPQLFFSNEYVMWVEF